MEQALRGQTHRRHSGNAFYLQSPLARRLGTSSAPLKERARSPRRLYTPGEEQTKSARAILGVMRKRVAVIPLLL
jgi:hypothetical protein